MPPKPRRIADRYEVTPLDGGGMATVWRGYDTVLDRAVAIKQIRGDRYPATMRRELAARFRREARVTAKIEHPGVPAIYDAAIDRDITDESDIERLYLVMQLVHGVTLAEILARHGRLPIRWAVAISAQVCTVLSHAHAVPIVHRDLKPSNLMVDHDGTVKVLDFGVAAVLGTDVTQLTETGRLVGSRDYMSPEQFLGAGVSPRSDLYALGCLLHEMLTGRKVFDGARDAALQHVHEPPTPVRMLRPDVDEAVERLVLELLAKAPEDRPGSAQAVFDRLEPFLPVPGIPRPRSGSSGDPVAAAVPDPTGPYRRPLAPRPPEPPEPPRSSAVEPDQLPSVWDAAERRAAALIDDTRFTQAVRVLDDAIAAGSPLLSGHPRLLGLRSTRAAALYLGRDFRRALEAFDALAVDYTRVAGPDDERVRECRTQSAHCHAALGEVEAALAGFRTLLDGEVRRAGDDRSPAALELRRQIGILLLAAQRLPEAVRVLRTLHGDLTATRAPSDPDLQEVHDLLARVRLTGGQVSARGSAPDTPTPP